MVSVRVKRGGLSLIISTDGGKTYLGLAPGSPKEAQDAIPCSIVGLYNVLSGVDYQAVGLGNHCLIRQQEKHVELVWRRGNTDTVFRLSASEYRTLLKQMSEGKEADA